MIYKTLIFFIFLFTIKINSQVKTITGFVKDSLNSPLEFANVIAKPSNKLAKLKYAITNEKGYYELNLVNKENYNVSVHYIGFEKFTFKIDSTTIFKTKNIFLKPSVNELDEIIIESLPIIVKEDTITYRTKSFVAGTERKLKQVLKKLPGIEVDKKGNIFSNGKKIKKLLVENKPFFGGNTKLAVENIPADAIDKVQVIDNYSEVAFLKGLTGSEDAVMNIKLKKDKKEFVFGDIKSGLGNEKYYSADASLFYYSPKSTANLILNTNDIGEKTLDFSDYLNFIGGVGKIIKDPNWYSNFSNSDIATFINDVDFKANKNQFGALNLSKVISSKTNISGFAILSKSKTEKQINSFTQNFVDNSIFSTEDKIDNSISDIKFGISKLMLDYKPNSKEEISFNSYIKITDNNSNNSINSISNNEVLNTIIKNLKVDELTIKQNLEWHKQYNPHHTFTINANYNYRKNTPKVNWQTNFPILNNFISLISDENFNISQIKSYQSNKFNFIIKHYWVLNNKNHIYTTLGNHFNHVNFRTKEEQIVSSGTINNFDNFGFGNDLKYQINNTFLKIQHKIKLGKIVVKSGFNLHQFSWFTKQNEDKYTNKFFILPNFLAKINFKKSETLKFNYSANVLFADANKYVNQFYLQNYQSFVKGNSNLENELFHKASISYRKFSLYRKLHINNSIHFKRKIKSLRNEIRIEDINIFSIPIISDNPETNYSINNSFKKGIKNIYTKIKVNYSLSEYKQITNNILTKNKNKNIDFDLSLQSKFDKLPNFEIGFNKTFNYFDFGTSKTKFTNEKPYITINYDFSDFIFKLDYSRNNFETDLGNKTIFETSDTTLFYQKEDSPFGFEIRIKNIFNTEIKRSSTFLNSLISDSKTFVQPRIILFSFSYKL